MLSVSCYFKTRKKSSVCDLADSFLLLIWKSKYLGGIWIHRTVLSLWPEWRKVFQKRKKQNIRKKQRMRLVLRPGTISLVRHVTAPLLNTELKTSILCFKTELTGVFRYIWEEIFLNCPYSITLNFCKYKSPDVHGHMPNPKCSPLNYYYVFFD